MADLKSCDLYLVGSMAVPSDTSDEAMRLATKKLGDRLSALPDGEVGKRAWWVGGLGLMTFSKHPQLEQVREKADTLRAERPHMEEWKEGEDALSRARPHVNWVPDDIGLYRRKRGVTRVDLERYLPYAEAAIGSYAIFRKLKEAGELSRDVRFQVALPTPFAGVHAFFSDVADWPEMTAAFQRALTADIKTILQVVPANELAIQWDYCVEVTDILGAASGRREVNELQPATPMSSAEEKFAQHTAPYYIRPLSDGIPEEVRFGYHVCLGTAPQFPTVATDDLAWVVRITNELVKNSPHRVDFLHLPATIDAGRSFFAPLRDLKVGKAKIFIGVGHRDGREAIAARARAAREFLPDFGISHYCGYGRDDSHRIGELLAELRGAADLLRK